MRGQQGHETTSPPGARSVSDGDPHTVEQQAYYPVEDGRIS
jgi:hypothetical protein